MGHTETRLIKVDALSVAQIAFAKIDKTLLIFSGFVGHKLQLNS